MKVSVPRGRVAERDDDRPVQTGDALQIDARGFSDTTSLEADLVIIGAGAAGLALAADMAGQGLSVLLAEAGGVEAGPEARPRLPVHADGPHAFNLGGRRRCFGGGLIDWGANCALLDPADFATDGPGSEAGLPPWPLDPAELAAHAARAAGFLGLSGDLAATAEGKTVGAPGPLAGEELVEKLYLRAPDGVPAAGRALLAPAEPTRVLTHARLAGISLDADGRRVTSLELRNPAGNRISVKPQVTVLAAGADTAFLLMTTLGADPEAVQRRWPAMGRWLHAHLLSLRGFLIPAGDPAPLLLRHAMPANLGVVAEEARDRFFGLRASAARRAAEGLLNGVVFLAPVRHREELMEPATVRRAARHRPVPFWQDRRLARHVPAPFARLFAPGLLALRHFMEQPPRWEARVSIDRESWARGRVEPRIAWSVGDEERRHQRRMAALVGQAATMAGLGRVEIDADEDSGPDLVRNAHPMGGTVMGDDSRRSVVDGMLRVHGIENLHVCGGSVLPRGGAAMVTGVIVQLALRLGAHLKSGAGR